MPEARNREAVIDRGDAEGPDRARPDARDVEFVYLFLPAAWGRGYAAEACAAALGWFASAAPGEAVVLCTQTADDRSMRLAATLGFTEVERFVEWGAEQWFGCGPRSRGPVELLLDGAGSTTRPRVGPG